MAQYDGLTDADLSAALAGKADTTHTHAHGNLTGLTNDDHPQYLNSTRGDARYYLKAEIDTAIAGKADASHSHTLGGLSDVGEEAPVDGQSLVWNATAGEWRPASLAEGGVVDHGALTGLGDDDHPQYLTAARGDVRYYLKAQVYTMAEVDAALAGKADAAHAHSLSALADVDVSAAADGQALVFIAGTGWRPATIQESGGVTDHGALTGLSDDDHPQYLTAARGDARYYTQAQLDAALAAKADAVTRVIVSADHTAQPEQIIAVDTDAAAVTITAPAAPAEGTYFFVGDAGGNAASNPITVDFAGAAFDGAVQTFEIDVNNFDTGFLFTGGEWELFG